MFERRIKSALLVAVAFLFGMAGSAFADTTLNLTFDTLSHTATDAQVQTYVQSFLKTGQKVTVTGAKAGWGYTGDGHVTGCKTKNCTTSTTLGGTNSTQDNFLINDGPNYNGITMSFTGVKFTTVSFDLEIFPDASCSNGTNGCGANWPDFTFYVNGVAVQAWQAIMPGSGTCTTNNPTSCDAYSSVSGSSKELAPQLITLNYVYTGPAGITSLAFEDWPAEIGIDNLKLTIPEPSSFVLLGSVLGMIGVIRRKFVA
jgi:hypothetical protein